MYYGEFGIQNPESGIRNPEKRNPRQHYPQFARTTTTYPLDKTIGFASVYPVDSVIHLLNNGGLVSSVF